MIAARLRPRISFAVPLALAGALLACSDSPHLYPPPDGAGGKTGTTTGSGGDGGGAPIACTSSSDCPEPQAICDVARAVCVECLEVQHCAFRPGTVCSKGECVCADEADSFCAASSKSGDARPARCVDVQTSSQDCGSCGHTCFGACKAGKCVDAWEPTPLGDAPAPRVRHGCAFTGSALLVWGGDAPGGPTATGGRLDVASGAWSPTSLANAPTPRSYVRSVWTGDRFVVWGGHDGAPLGTGAVYDPATDTWKPMATAGAPSPRLHHGMVWAESAKRVLVWGGVDSTDNLGTGAQYDPMTDTWSPITTDAAPTQRRQHVTVWNGSRMLVWGGYGFDGTGDAYLDTGKLYDPAADVWEDLPASPPLPRADAAATSTSAGVFVWGGTTSGMPGILGDGATLTAVPAWTPTGGPNPSIRHFHTAVWLDGPKRVVVWGGDGGVRLADGGIFDPAAAQNTWAATPMPTGPSARANHCAVSTGATMIVWGGETNAGITSTGGVFTPP